MIQIKLGNTDGVFDEDKIVSYDSESKPYSLYKDDKWRIFDHDFEVNFSRVTGDIKSDVKALVYSVICENSLKSKKSTIKNFIDGASVFEKCIKSCGGRNYQFLDDGASYRKVIEEAKSRKLKFKTWKNSLIFITRLYDTGLIKKDIGMAETLARYLSSNDGAVTQTMAIPENIASKYFAAALQVVEEYHNHRCSISNAYKQFITEYRNEIKKGYGQATAKKYALMNINTLIGIDIRFDYSGGWLSWIRGACYFVIAAFTGCRDGEIKSFNLSSYEEKEYAGMVIPILKGSHTKPNIGGVVRSTSWVTIPSVKKAIELLWEVFEFARDEWEKEAEKITHIDEKARFLSDINSLFLTLPYNTATKPKAGRQAMSKSLQTFVKAVDYRASIKDVKEFNLLNPTRVGELKAGEMLIPHPHAFRRTFAVYLVRYRLGSLLDLKYQFKHMHAAMTSWYSNQAHLASYFDLMMDTDLQAEISDENHAHITDTLYYIYNDAKTLAGPEGKRIMNLRSESPTTIYLSRNEIAKQVEEGRLSIIEQPSGHCTNPRCDRICDMTTCQYKVVTKEKAIDLMVTRERLIKKFEMLESAGVNQPNIMSKIFYEVRSMEKIFDEHNMEYEKFDANITATIL